ncbi:HlyD family secretion protein [Microvirga sp. W0021]|uniref:HlyD family secretion protein n=1 Tax=Hohaiivirga grylli TaxID=3133970 RepID=A0ABV0BIB9_9HYPH
MSVPEANVVPKDSEELDKSKTTEGLALSREPWKLDRIIRLSRAAMTRSAPVLAIIIVLSGVLLVMHNWNRWDGAATYQRTDNATIKANLASLDAKVSGYVSIVAIKDFQEVHKGDLLVEIDDREYVAAVDQAKAAVLSAEASLANLSNQEELQKATIQQAEASLQSVIARYDQAKRDSDRQNELIKTGFTSKQNYENATMNLQTAASNKEAANATLLAARRQLDVLHGQRASLEANVASAKAQLELAEIKLKDTRIVAPFDGIVGERKIQVGDYVTAGKQVSSLVSLPSIYVIANFKETQLTHIEVGQPVSVEIDTFPGETLRGRVESIAPASGSEFALLPADNATGNFTKVVQRIPVRIDFEPGQKLLSQLRPGMSVTPEIDTRGQFVASYNANSSTETADVR